jgi:hypothetical protein
MKNGSALVRQLRPSRANASSLIARVKMWLIGQRIGRTSSRKRKVVL